MGSFSGDLTIRDHEQADITTCKTKETQKTDCTETVSKIIGGKRCRDYIKQFYCIQIITLNICGGP